MRKFIAGLIIGLAISGSVAFAAENYSVVQNAFPIYVNGTQENVEALNINGTTWIRLGSIAGILGAGVTFDEVSKQINITGGDRKMTEEELKAADEAYAKAEEEAAQRAAERKAAELGKSIPKYYTQDDLEMMEYNSKKYVQPGSIFHKYASYMDWKYDNNKILTLCKPNQGANLIDTVPHILINDRMWIEYDYYTDTILPLIQ